MSALPQRTRILIKDLLFQEKYKLTNTQVDIMSYIFNSLSWAIKIDGFLIITTKKLISDMPQITQKTLESSLRALKSMELIESELVAVAQWKGANVRGVKITKKGMEYNASLYLPSAKKIFESLEEDISSKDKELDIRQKKIDELEKIVENLKVSEIKEDKKESIEPKEEENKTIKIEDFKEFIDAVKSEYIKTSEPICNMVKGWKRETIFSINSYNRVSITTPNGEYMQLKDPKEINKFWKWLYIRQHRVGDIIDFKKPLTAKELNRRYKGENLEIGNKKYKLYNIEEAEDTRVKITLKDENGKIATISDKENANRPLTYSYANCEEILLRIIC